MDTDCLRQVLDQVRENPSNQVCVDCGMEGKIRLLWIPIVYDRCWTKSGKTPVTRCVLTVEWKVRSGYYGYQLFTTGAGPGQGKPQ